METIRISLPVWNIEQITGYKPITTFWQDFSIADKFGLDAVKDTFKRAFSEWKCEYKYITELALVLNHKGWQHYDRNCGDANELSQLYFSLWEELDSWCADNLDEEAISYYYQTTD